MNSLKYAVLIRMFLGWLDADDQKRYAARKLINALDRVRRDARSDEYNRAVHAVDRAIKQSLHDVGADGTAIAIDKMCWLIASRHWEDLKQFNLDPEWFASLHRIGVQRCAMSSAKVLNLIEEYL